MCQIICDVNGLKFEKYKNTSKISKIDSDVFVG